MLSAATGLNTKDLTKEIMRSINDEVYRNEQNELQEKKASE